jgi:hypothetical protein
MTSSSGTQRRATSDESLRQLERRGGFSPQSIRGHNGRTRLGDATGNRKGQS